MILYIARHGEATWNIEKRILGSTPGKLSVLGLSQAQQLGQNIKELGIKKGYVSDLYRTIQTAHVVTDQNPDLIFTQTRSLRERSFGDLEGKLFAEVNWIKFWEMPANSTPYNSESLNAFTERISKFIIELESVDHDTVLLITHNGPMNRFNYLSNPANFEPTDFDNATPVLFDYDAMKVNAHNFLDGKLAAK